MNKKNQFVPIYFVAALAFLLAVPVAHATTAVGTIAGSFGVTRTGGATYTIPLPTPGGVNGLSPNLSIDYASGSGPGMLGWDMTIGGLSVIKRCPSSWPYDGTEKPVDLTSSDRFCLNGRELSMEYSGGTYGANGTTYETTPTAHLQAISYGSNDMPNYFIVDHPDGSQWEYGNTSDSYVTATNSSGTAVRRVWLLDKITDVNGNTITFHYNLPSGTGAYYLTSVDWGGAENRSMTFQYTPVGTDATVYRYVDNNKITWNQRLHIVTQKDNGSTTLTWTMGYLTDGQGSNRSRLSSVQECDGSGNCFPDTNFSWQQGSPGFGAATDTGEGTTTTTDRFVEDVDGDGRDDLVYNCGGYWCIRFGQAGGGFGPPQNTNIAVIDGSYAQPIHYEPGAGNQILIVQSYSGTDDWAILSWSNGSFNPPIDTGIAVTGEADATDVNGDGYDDLVTYNGAQLIVYLNATLTTGVGFGSAITAYTDNNAENYVGFRYVGSSASRGPQRAIHFAQGSSGIITRNYHHEKLCANAGCTQYTYLTYYTDGAYVWQNKAFVPYSGTFDQSSTNEAGGQVVALDVNGDGLTDLVLLDSAKLLLNNGSGFKYVTYGSSTSGLTLASAVGVDYNGNGRDDLLVPSTSTGDWMLLASTGNGFGAPVDTGVSSGAFVSSPAVADTEGRMMDDLIGVNGSGDIELALRNGGYPDEVNEIEDGFGNYNKKLTWVPRSDTSVVSNVTSTLKKYENYRRGQYLLESDTKNDGIGGSYIVSYSYGSPMIQPGVGPAGISQVTKSDNRAQSDTTVTNYDLTAFAQDLPKNVTIKTSSGATLKNIVYKYSLKGYMEKNKPIEVWQIITSNYGGNSNKLDTVTKTYTYDSDAVVNDIKVVTVQNSNGDTWTTDTALSNDVSETTSDWCVGLLSSKTVTDTVYTGVSQSRETIYTPDLAKCRYSSYTSNYNLNSSLQATVSLTYGSMGNLTKKVVSGSGVSQTTSYTPGPNGEFITQVKDAAQDVTQYTWKEAYGTKSSMTAPNGSVTSYSYNGFGRLIKTILPTGAYSKVTYANCPSSCSRWVYSAQTNLYDSSGASAGEKTTYYDRYGRVYERDVERLGGNIAKSLTYYNQLGQVTNQSVPYYKGNQSYWTTYSYDGLGRITEINNPASTSTTAPTSATYNGYQAIINGPNGYKKTVTKNPLGQIKTVTDAGGNSSTYTYGPFGELTQVVGADKEPTYLYYDGAGYRTELKGPDRGTIQFQVNAIGAPVSETNANGQAITMSYDGLGRLVQRTFPNPTASGTETQKWIYAHSGNGAGQLSSESDDVTGFSRTVGYNSYGKINQISQSVGGGSTQTQTIHHDSLGRVSSVIYPVSVGGTPLEVDYHYDSSGNLDKVTNANTGTVYWQPETNLSTPAMDALGQMEDYVLGGGLDVERLHDAATGAVTSITSGPNGSGSVLNLTSTYYKSGSRWTLDDLNESLDDSYQYDNYQRLTKVTRTGSAGTTYSNFSYYAAGQFDKGPGGVYQYGGSSPAPAHSPTSVGTGGLYSFGYNAAGDRTQWTSPSYDLAPVAKASASPTTLTSAGTVTLDGSASYDPDNGPQPLSYQWSVISQPSNASVSITNATSADASVSVSLAGTYTFGLTVSDGQKTDSTQVTVQANILPTLASAPGLSPNPSSSGTYTVSWSKPSNTTSFKLNESSNGGSSWSQVYSGGNTSWSPASAKADGSYEYELKNCNSVGCSGWSGAATENVQLAPGAPSLSPNPSATGNYTVSWPSISGATSYDLDESGSQIYSGSSTSWSPSSAKANGNYSYKVRACSSGGCSAFSGTSTETVNLTPGVPTNLRLSVVQRGVGGSYLVEWNAPSYGAVTQYDLQRSTTSSFSSSTTYTTTYTSHSFTYGGTGATHYYRVRACHNSYCSGWSSTLTETDPTSGGCLTCSPTVQSTTTSPSAGTGGGADPTVKWDAIGKARTITTSTATINLVYSPDGDLVQETGSNGGVYLGKWMKSTDSNNWSARIIVMGRVIAVVKDSGGSVNTNYLLRGPLGSTQAVASGGGSLVQRIAYSAWGSFVQPSTGTGSVPDSSIAQYTTVTYTGHELITGTGLINMGARIYDPATGIFMSPDPTVAHPYDTQDLNQYAYVEDNPMSRVDSSGYGSVLPKMIVGACALGDYGVWPNCYNAAYLQQLFDGTGGAGGAHGAGFNGTRDYRKRISEKAKCNIDHAIGAEMASELSGQNLNSIKNAMAATVLGENSGASMSGILGIENTWLTIFGSYGLDSTAVADTNSHFNFTNKPTNAGYQSLNGVFSNAINAAAFQDFKTISGIAISGVYGDPSGGADFLGNKTLYHLGNGVFLTGKTDVGRQSEEWYGCGKL